MNSQDEASNELALTAQQYETLELSTKLLIRSARRRKLKVDVLDLQANFLRLQRGSKIEYIKEATKTSLDTYVSFACMEDKHISKLLLKQNGLRVPEGFCFHSLEEGLKQKKELPKMGWIVKPSTTNFGIGINRLSAEASSQKYEEALKLAFSHAERVIVEEFIPGSEYRFLVMGMECVAVCHRIPANVYGDGKSSIAELVHRKNEDPRRGLGHTQPLEKIQLSFVEKNFLKESGLHADSVPAQDQQVFLRSNSNVSTGGDSIDYSDRVAPSYKELAIRAAQSVRANICGVDMIMTEPDSYSPQKASYAILELNFNPVLYIHECPAQGQPRPVSDKLLDLLGF